MKGKWIIITALFFVASCANNEKKATPVCSPLTKADFNKDSKDILDDLNICLSSKNFNLAAEKFYALASKDKMIISSGNRQKTTHIQTLKQILKVNHTDAAIESMQIEINKIKNSNTELCNRLGVFNGDDDIRFALKNSKDQKLIDEINKSFVKNDNWRSSLSELLDCKSH